MPNLLHPERFQSHPWRDRWFEGWYFKLCPETGDSAIAVIPGVSRDESGGTSHSFVQVITSEGAVVYARYPYEAFRHERDRFEIAVADSRFTADGLSLVIPAGDDHPAIEADIEFGPLMPWPVSIISPGIMGWYRYVPRMECYHGVVSMHHALSGSLAIGEMRLSMDGGLGYAEKDWGTSFPSSWCWMQSNDFVDEQGRALTGASVTCSVARIPWLGSSFIGHIGGLLLPDGRLHRFASYTGSRILSVDTSDGAARVRLSDGKFELSVSAEGAHVGSLKAPLLGAMAGRAHESLGGRITAELFDVSGGRRRSLFSGTGRCAGVEVMNDRDELRADRRR